MEPFSIEELDRDHKKQRLNTISSSPNSRNISQYSPSIITSTVGSISQEEAEHNRTLNQYYSFTEPTSSSNGFYQTRIPTRYLLTLSQENF